MFQKTVNALSKNAEDYYSKYLEQFRQIKESSTNSFDDKLKYLDLIKDVDSNIKNLYLLIERLEKINPSYEAAVNAKSIVEEETGPAIVERQVMRAVAINKEFDDAPYLSRLEQLIYTPGLIQIKIDEKNIENSKAILNIAQYGGNTRQWSEAIDYVRKMTMSGSRASKDASRPGAPHEFARQLPEVFKNAVAPPKQEAKFWAEKIYGVAREGRQLWTKGGARIAVNPKNNEKYYKEIPRIHRTDKEDRYRQLYYEIINQRLSYSKSIAPFWELLDRGSASFPKGDSPYSYPVNRRTNFVNLSMQDLKSAFLTEYGAQVFEYKRLKDSSIHRIELKIARLKKIYHDILNEMDKINQAKKLEDVYTKYTIKSREMVNDWISSTFTEKELFELNSKKLDQLVYDLINLRTETFNKDMRRRLGGSGVRKRYKDIYKRLEDLYNNLRNA